MLLLLWFLTKMASPLRKAIDVLDRLEVANGPLAREAILEQHRDNKTLQSIIKMAVGPARYFVRPSSNIVPTSAMEPIESWREFKKLTNRLKNREVTGNAARREVQVFLANCRPALLKWFCRILNHDLRCGIDKKTVQKIWGSSFLLADSAVGVEWRFAGCALAKPYHKVYRKTKRGEKKPQFPLAVESKYDGERALLICFPRDNNVFVLTRSGRRREPIEQTDEWVDQVLDLCRNLNEDTSPDRPLFLDGEFLARKWNDTSSIVRRTKNFNREKFLTDVRAILWDWSPLDQYLQGSFEMKWLQRKTRLQHAAGADRPTDKLTKFRKNVWVSGHSMVYSDEQLQAEYSRRLDAGYEGVMLKNPDAPHRFKRTVDNIKLKPEDSQTGRIIDLHPGKGQHGAAPKSVCKKVLQVMKRVGKLEQDDGYLHCKTKKPEQVIKAIKEITEGDNERRISTHLEDTVTFRHGERLGYLVVELPDGQQIHVGGGFKYKAGQDQRMKFWQKRDELVGMEVDFKQQADANTVAVGRFNSFVRLREDLS